MLFFLKNMFQTNNYFMYSCTKYVSFTFLFYNFNCSHYSECIQDHCKHLRWRAFQQLKSINYCYKALYFRCLQGSWLCLCLLFKAEKRAYVLKVKTKVSKYEWKLKYTLFSYYYSIKNKHIFCLLRIQQR